MGHMVTTQVPEGTPMADVGLVTQHWHEGSSKLSLRDRHGKGDVDQPQMKEATNTADDKMTDANRTTERPAPAGLSFLVLARKMVEEMHVRRGGAK